MFALTACGQSSTAPSSPPDASVVLDAGGPPSPPPPTFLMGGHVSGLTETGLILQLWSDTQNEGYIDWEELPVNENRGFVFQSRLPSGAWYIVNVVQQPPTQVCSVSNEEGTVENADMTNIEVTCVPGRTVGGTVSGLLPGSAVTLQRLNKWDAVTVGNGPFTFPFVLASGTDYTVSVAEQPARQTCTVTPSTPQTVPESNVSDIVVNCTCSNAYVREGDACTGTYVSVAPGGCGVRTNGTLWCWDWHAQTDHSASSSRPSAAQVGTDNDWASVILGVGGNCGLKKDHTLWCWGNIPYDGVGDGTPVLSSSPAQIGTATWSSAAIGFGHICGVQTDGSLWCWGTNSFGQIGDGTTTDRVAPVQVSAAKEWVVVAAGAYHSCGLRANGVLWCWGDNFSGQIGYGDWKNRTAPVWVGGSRTWSTVAAGVSHTCAISTDGTLSCWGENDNGRLGYEAFADQNVPHQVGTDATWTSLTAGYAHTCALAANRDIWCWGASEYGQVGNGLTTDQPLPVMSNYVGGWTSVVAGGDSTCSTKADGTHWCWGGGSSLLQVIEPP